MYAEKNKPFYDFLLLDKVSVIYKWQESYISVTKDVKTRISFTFAYDKLNSKNAKDFLEKLINVMPFKIKGI
jgi:hypothetical protein